MNTTTHTQKKRVSFCDFVTVTSIPRESCRNIYRFVCNKISSGSSASVKADVPLSKENTAISNKVSETCPLSVNKRKSDWQSDDLIDIRNNMVLRIENILRNRPDADESWLMNLTKLALSLEKKLYREAITFEEYADPESILPRLVDLVNEMKATQSTITVSTTSTTNKRQSCQSEAESPKRVKTEEDSYSLLKRQRQRLLLLHHASKCRSDNDKCLHKQLCQEMRSVWTHIHTCKDNNCPKMHCLSSRYALSHYAHCKDDSCEVCVPVRKVLDKKHSC